jgi:quercetin dioxygenase-like cupin family protein
LRVLELYAPPPSKGTSGAYARTKPLLEDVRYAAVDGASPTLHKPEVVWQRDLGVLAGVVSRTEHLTVLGLEVSPGQTSEQHAHAGDEILYVTSGTLWVRAWDNERAYVFELEPRDACFIPGDCRHEYRNIDAGMAKATVGIAPPD